jgi:hypothetical protein
MRITHADPFALDLDEWPRDVELIISALFAAGRDSHDSRGPMRRRYRVIAQLSLFCNVADPPTRLYVRDCTDRHVGFLTSTPVPLGYGGTVEMPKPDGTPLSAACVVHRCRECVPGWFEGALYFNRVQPELKFPQ